MQEHKDCLNLKHIEAYESSSIVQSELKVPITPKRFIHLNKSPGFYGNFCEKSFGVAFFLFFSTVCQSAHFWFLFVPLPRNKENGSN